MQSFLKVFDNTRFPKSYRIRLFNDAITLHGISNNRLTISSRGVNR